jgi:multimeric flavodoxin WrbA/nitrite reductase/ring-hydroxylating ferredoxin subunit
MPEPRWQRLGLAAELSSRPIQAITIGRTRIALTFEGGRFAAISGACNHVGGPLGEGRLDGVYVVCPWHNWKYHRITGQGEPGYEDEMVPRYELEVRGEELWINLEAVTRRTRLPHPPHPLARPVLRDPGPVRVAGISTTAMDLANPRFSTSEVLLDAALARARTRGADTKLIRLAELSFRHCEGYYSKSAHACTWPCSITQMDPNDQLDRVYEAMVHWADVILLATPIRWGSASSLYFKLAERLNCVQNQTTIRNRVLIKNKTAAFIVTGGQDNVQGVVGQMLTFFGELGFVFPQFPFIAHSRGWSAEDMENNVREVRDSVDLREGAEQLIDRAINLACELVERAPTVDTVAHGGRKAQPLMK